MDIFLLGIIIVGISIFIITLLKVKPAKTQLKSLSEKQKLEQLDKEEQEKKLKKLQQQQQQQQQGEDKQLSMRELKKIASQSNKTNKQKKKVTVPTDPSYLNGFKGFASDITAYCIHEDIIIIASKDKTFKIFNLKQIADTTKEMVYYKHQLDYFHASAIAIHKGKKLIAVGLADEKTIELFSFSVTKTGDKQQFQASSLKKFPRKMFSEDIMNVYFAQEAQYLIACSSQSDTNIKVFELNGYTQVSNLNTNQVKHYFSFFSQNSRFLLMGTWQADVKVMEIKFEKNNTFKSFGKAMDLGGHKSAVKYVSCNNLEDKALTISDDQTVKIWKMNVKYEMKEDPKCILTIDIKNNKFFQDNQGAPITAGSLYTYAESGQTFVALSCKNSLVVVDLQSQEVVQDIENACSEDDIISDIRFVQLSAKIIYILATCIQDARINVFTLKL